jgi:hypothetical protein
MAHVLARLRDVKFETIEAILKADSAEHAKQSLYLEYLWKNVDDENEVLFLFRSDDLNRSKEFITRVHSQARAENPEANLPEITYLGF